jgi:MFS superfamily sulfate permease-like transporter
MLTNIRQNFISGLLVSFIALPLCIAISIASDFPVLSGIFTAIIGGILVSQISGSSLTINGPAAGMIVVILDAVEKLGEGDLAMGYKYTLAAIVCAAILQVATSFTKLPELMRKFPESIIRGMMMAIGTIVILKQIFILLGFKAPKVPLLELATFIPQGFSGMQIETFAIGVGVIILIYIWKKFFEKNHFFRAIPVYLVAIILASSAAFYLDISNNRHFFDITNSQPVSAIFIDLPNNIKSAFTFPDFGKIFSTTFFIEVLSIFAVGSLETILSAIAVDKIDPQNRTTNLKKDLRGVGFGNLVCGFVGALPMIAEIVRSSANVKYGATNNKSNFFHGICLLLMITLLSPFLKFIPLCVLAAMLLMIGYNMLNLPLFIKIFRERKLDFMTILSVIFFTLYVDLLVGITCGLITFFILKKLNNLCAKSS